jgi:hypothetical protein
MNQVGASIFASNIDSYGRKIFDMVKNVPRLFSSISTELGGFCFRALA